MPASMPKLTAVTRKLHEAVYKTLLQALKDETWEEPWGDAQLTEEVKKRGTFCSKTILRDVRLAYGIPGSRERRFANFAKGAKK